MAADATMGSMGGTLLASPLRRALAEHARAAWPEEACGLLVGVGGVPREAVRLTNCASDALRRYALDPLEYMRVERTAERRGLGVVGVWHSHPDGGAEPSETDRRAAWPGWLYVIISLPGDGSSCIRAWRLVANEFVEEELHAESS